MPHIFTKTGDLGETSLANGKREIKSSDRVSVYGDLDELTSFIGHLISLLDKNKKFQLQIETLIAVQKKLFYAGFEIANPNFDINTVKYDYIKDSDIIILEELIIEFEKELPELTNFILPNGLEASSFAQVCRAVTRRVERSVVNFARSSSDKNSVRIELIKYLNRLSDYLFMLARFINFKSKIEEQNLD